MPELLVLAVALGYAFLNGVHDAPAVLAEVISTRSMEPRKALLWVASLEFIGAAFFSAAVLQTMSFADIKAAMGPHETGLLPMFVLSCLAASMLFNAITAYLGIPSSSSHALFGAMAGSALALGFGGEVFFVKIAKLVVILMASALVATAVAWLITTFLYSIHIPYTAGQAFFPKFNTLTSGLLALLHGANDAPKSMGLYLLAANGMANAHCVYWFAAAMSLGTLFGENQILRTLGFKLFRIRTLQGSGANAASCAVMGVCTALGLPTSFTQVLVGSISGSGAARRVHSVRWETAGEILISWLVTLPISMALGYLVAEILARGFR